MQFFFVFKGRSRRRSWGAAIEETAAQTLSTDREKQGNSQRCAQPDRVSRDTRSSSEGTRHSKWFNASRVLDLSNAKSEKMYSYTSRPSPWKLKVPE